MTGTVQYSFRRVEKKYFLTPQQYQQMCVGMAAYMQADQHARYTIGNLYYDTENYALIRTSLEKPVYKEKLRIRSYGVPGDRDKVFVELKKSMTAWCTSAGCLWKQPLPSGICPTASGRKTRSRSTMKSTGSCTCTNRNPGYSSAMSGRPMPVSSCRICGSPLIPAFDGA